MEQINFEGTTACSVFRSNPYARSGKIVRICVHGDCGLDISCHRAEAVSESEIKKILESTEKYPSLIIPGIFLGGFTAAMNLSFLEKHNIRLVINAAKGLATHFPKLKTVQQGYMEHNIKLQEMEWEDSCEQVISIVDILRIARSIDGTLREGGAVLVHCAQGRSRSATIVIAYLMWSRTINYDASFQLVKRARDMAQPNTGFEAQLRAYEGSLCCDSASPILPPHSACSSEDEESIITSGEPNNNCSF